MDPALQKEVETLIAGAVASAVKPMTEQVGQLAEAVKPVGALVKNVEDLHANVKVVADTVAAQKILGEDQVKKLVADQTASLTEAARKDADAKAAADTLKTKRSAFATEHLKNVPARYHAELGDDETKWADAAKGIRTAFAEDLKSAGVKVPDVGGAAGGEAVAGTPGGGGFLQMPGAAAAPAAAGGVAGAGGGAGGEQRSRHPREQRVPYM
jgi:seryl-tRNA synthetase